MRRLSLGILVITGALSFGCDGGGDDEDAPPPPPKFTQFLFDMSDPCAPQVPSPTDLFVDEDGKSELAACPGPEDPIENALFFAQLDEGVPLNAEIVLPIEGSLDGASLSSTVSLSLTSSAGAGLVPPLVMLKGSSTGTAASDFEVVPVSASFDQAIRVQPSIALETGSFYVVVATDAIKDGERPQKPVIAAPQTELLVGSTPIAAGALEGLDAGGAARLERMRLKLAPILELLAGASPPIAAEQIVAITAFTTSPDPLVRTTAIFEAYQAAVRQDRYPFEVTTIGGDLDPAELYPGLPPAAYAAILAYRRGTIRVPAFLGDDLRQRDGFPQVVREIEVPFIFTLPRSPPPHGVVLYLPGYGRSKLDARALANEMAATADTAVLAIDLRCHGDRSPDESGVCADERTESEVAELEDVEPNNGNMELVGADGIPDASGQFFFPGDARALRDSQIANAIEILHVYSALRAGTPFAGEGLSVTPGEIHLVAHGHSTFAALLAVAYAGVPPRTVQIPAGGAGFAELIFDGPQALTDSFVATLPDGVGADRASEYLARLEAGFLRPVSIDTIGPLVTEQVTFGGQVRQILLNHGSGASAVPVTARERLIDAVEIPTSRVSRHSPSCDDFFIFSCRLGIDNPVAPREQMTTFVSSSGATVLPP